MKEKVFMVDGREIRIQGRLLRTARIEGDKYKFLDDPESLIHSLKKSGTRVDLFTFMQRLPETSPKYHYPMEWDNLAALPVSTFEHWWAHQIRSYPRNRARQAEKRGAVIREVSFDDAFVQGISQIYNETPIRQGRRFRHYGKSIESVWEEEGTFRDSSVFIGVFLGARMIGFAKLVIDETGTQAGLMNILSLIEQRDKAPTNALIAQAVRSCASRGIAYLVYSNFAYGKKQRDSLSDFKENNGFQRIDLPRYYVPLTSVGEIALRLGLHRRLIDRVPEQVIAKARELRNLWHNRRLEASTEAS